LRFELLEIFTNNSWDVPDIEKKSQGKGSLPTSKMATYTCLKIVVAVYMKKLFIIS